jgi:hypothetical protein
LAQIAKNVLNGIHKEESLDVVSSDDSVCAGACRTEGYIEYTQEWTIAGDWMRAPRGRGFYRVILNDENSIVAFVKEQLIVNQRNARRWLCRAAGSSSRVGVLSALYDWPLPSRPSASASASARL